MDAGWTRRNLLKAGAIGAVSFAGSGLLSGCAVGATPTASSQRTKLVLAPWVGGYGSISGLEERLQVALQPFLKANRSIDVSIDYVISGNNTALEAAIISGSGPDVFTSWFDPNTFFDKDLTLPLNSYLQSWGASPSLWTATQFDLYTTSKGQMALPCYLGTKALAVNLGMLDNLGVAYPTADWTWEQAESFWRNTANPAKHILGIGFDNDGTGVPNNFLFEAWGGAIVRSSNRAVCTLAESSSLACAAVLYPLLLEGVAGDGAGTVSQFANGQYVTRSTGTWELVSALEQWTSMNWSLLPFPAGPVASTTYANSDFYAISAETAHPEEAALLLRFLAVEPGWQTSMMRLFLLSPALKSLWPDWSEQAIAAAPSLAKKNLDAFTQLALTNNAYPDAMFAYADSQAYHDLSAWGGLIIGGQIDYTAGLQQATSQINELEQLAAKENAGASAARSVLSSVPPGAHQRYPTPSSTGVGTPGVTNSSLLVVRDGTYLLTGAGSGISTGSTDAGSFASHVSTASEQTYTVELSQISLGTSTRLHYWSAFGLMARGDLSNTAAMILLAVTGGTGMVLMIRPEPGASPVIKGPITPLSTTGLIGSSVLLPPYRAPNPSPATASQATSTASAGSNLLRRPVWLRLQRLGAQWTAFSSSDGTTWTATGPGVTVDMPGCFVGLFATSASAGKTVIAGFEKPSFATTQVTEWASA